MRSLAFLTLAYVFYFPSFVFCQPLDINTAVQRAVDTAPSIMVFEENVEEAFGDYVQASLLPNPEFEFELDPPNFGRNYSCNETEVSYGISQLIELGGKRGTRMQITSSAEEISLWDLEHSKRDVARKAAGAFMDVVTAQHEVEHNEEARNLAQTMQKTVAEKVKAGKYSPMEERKAALEFAKSELAYERSVRDLVIAKEKLIGLWGCQQMDFESVIYPFAEISELESIECYLGFLEGNPTVARWDAEWDAAFHNLELQRLQRIPDLTVEGGVTHEGRFDKVGVYFGFSIPIPVFDRNQGNILKAEAELRQIESQREDALLTLQSGVKETFRQMESLRREAMKFKKLVYDGTEETVKDMEEGFRRGKFDFIEVLDAQKTFIEVEDHYIHLLLDYHKKKIDLEYWIK